MNENFIVYAPGVHTGGSAVLLSELLSTVLPDFSLIAFVDSRFNLR